MLYDAHRISGLHMVVNLSTRTHTGEAAAEAAVHGDRCHPEKNVERDIGQVNRKIKRHFQLKYLLLLSKL